ncbi:MAG: hypothetical protein HZC12_03670, partial [Nitrospirae bacterium]|nr:hypothetical protein [Nitrospirota bacterium]
TASNPLPGGGTSNKATFTVLNTLPSLTSINPTSTVEGSPEFTLTLTGDNFVKASIVSFNDQQFSSRYISKTQIEATIPSEAIKTVGSYQVKVINPAPGGGESSVLTFIVKLPLEIKITSPTDGETINKTKIIVKGTFKSDTKDIGITVNGLIAETMGNEWIANNVPLTVGTNTITATIKDSLGNSASASITVNTTDITQPIGLSANITSGIAPLQVYFSVSTSFTPVSYQMDFEGDGVIDYTGQTFENISHTYTSEGIFYPTLTVTDDQGNTYSDTIAITVLNKTEIDTLLKGKWEGMKNKLQSGDIEGMMEYFDLSVQDTYREQFKALLSVANEIVNDLNTAQINLVEIDDIKAEYELLTFRAGKALSFHLVFVKDSSGFWRIWRF